MLYIFSIMATTSFYWVEFFSVCETPEWFCGLENISGASVDIQTMMRKKITKWHFFGCAQLKFDAL